MVLIIIEIKCTINVIRLNHPKTITRRDPASSVEKLFSMKLVSGAKMIGDCCCNLSREKGSLGTSIHTLNNVLP